MSTPILAKTTKKVFLPLMKMIILIKLRNETISTIKTGNRSITNKI